MRANRSMPTATIIPVLMYDNVPQAAEWLCRTFGFAERLRIGTHRVQLTFEGHANAALIVAQAQQDPAITMAAPPHDTSTETIEDTSPAISTNAPYRAISSHSILLRVEDVNAHHAHATAMGARITSAPTDFPFGERQYSAVDIGGHAWTFSQSIADCDPAVWGGQLV